MKYFIYRHKFIDGKWFKEKQFKVKIFAPVNKETGEVEDDWVCGFDSELEPLSPGWEWVEFELIPAQHDSMYEPI